MAREEGPGASRYPEFPSEENTFLDIWPGAHVISREDAVRCMEIIWDHFGETDRDKKKLCEGFYQQQRSHSGSVWLEALRNAYRSQKTKITSIAYIDRVAAKIEADGGVPDRSPKPTPGVNGAVSPSKKPSLAERSAAQATALKSIDKSKLPTDEEAIHGYS